ncbi:hypothetical protein [Pseudochryseolinea flava]|uniref:Uncharacterized protein n=1 Tax=Pseudochryseolinea flava TaxID=2059302 RepID=A0A364XY08_9BACT|nr:hypothetical protein [Pseudochryseolinea flava]RAV98879.1 hypothetical protein DQQ10_21495 [Pseudochryseolinea flava]
MSIIQHALSAAVSGSTSWSPVLPPGIKAGMLIVVPLANKLSTQAPTMLSVGYVKGAEYVGGAGSNGADSGPARITVWYKVAEGNESGQTLEISATSASGNNGVCRPIVYKKDDNKLWDLQFSKGKDDTGASTLYLATSETNLDMNVGDYVLCLTSQTDGTQSSNATSGTGVNGLANNTRATGFTFTGLSKIVDNRSSGGNHSSLLVTHASVSSGIGAGAVTSQYTFGGTPANAAGVSGATVFIRIRERSIQPISLHAVSSHTNGSSSWSPVLPSGITAGMLIIVPLASKLSTQAPTMVTAGFTKAGEYIGGAGANGVDSGPIRMTVWYKIADGSEGGQTLSITAPAATGNNGLCRPMVYAKDVDLHWQLAFAIGKDDAGGSVAYNAQAESVLNLTAGDVILCSTAHNESTSAVQDNVTSATGISFGTVAEVIDSRSSGGYHSGLLVTENPVTSGSGEVLITHQFNYTTAPVGGGVSGATLFIRLRQGLQSFKKVTRKLIGTLGQNIEGTAKAFIPVPSGISVGDIMIMNVVSKHAECRPKTPTDLGFRRLAESLSNHDEAGSDVGPTVFNTFFKIADTADTTRTSVEIDLEPASTRADHISGQILVFSRDEAATVYVDVVDGGNNFASNTVAMSLNWSALANRHLALRNDDLVIAASGANTDAYSWGSTQSLTGTGGVTFAKVEDLYEQPANSGKDSEHFASLYRVTSPAETLSQLTLTATATGTDAVRRPAGQTHFIRIRQTAAAEAYVPSCAFIHHPAFQPNSTIAVKDGVSDQTLWNRGAPDWEKAINTSSDPTYSIVTRNSKKFFKLKRNFTNGVSPANLNLIERRAEYYLKWQPMTQLGTKRNITWEVEIDSMPAPPLQYIIHQDHPGSAPGYTTNHPIFAIEIARADQYVQDKGAGTPIKAPAGAIIFCHNVHSAGGSSKYWMATHNGVPYEDGGTPILYTGTKRLRFEFAVKYGIASEGSVYLRVSDLTNGLTYVYSNSTEPTVALTASQLGSVELVGGAFKQGGYFHQISGSNATDAAAACQEYIDAGMSTYEAHYAYWAYAERQPTDVDYDDAFDDVVLNYLRNQVE